MSTLYTTEGHVSMHCTIIWDQANFMHCFVFSYEQEAKNWCYKSFVFAERLNNWTLPIAILENKQTNKGRTRSRLPAKKFTMVYYSKFTMVYYSKTQCFCGIFTTLYHSKYYGLP